MNQASNIDYKKAFEDSQIRISILEAELAQFRRLIFGKKSERFITEEIPFPQGSLFAPQEIEITKEENTTENLTEQITYERNKLLRKKGGRKELPSHLKREVIIIEPENKLESDRHIGTLVTEELEYIPGIMLVNRIERPKYIDDKTEEIKVASIPTRPVPKSQFSAQMMAHVICNKYVDHNPLYRQIEQFKRNHEVVISRSSLGESVHQYMDLLTPLYDALKKEVLSQEYLQNDETPYKVQSEEKKGSTHLGYFWASRSPIHNQVLFTYQRGRSEAHMVDHLQGFFGKLQTDGYKTYEKFEHDPNTILFSCWAHARRYFDQALETHPQEAKKVLAYIQELYKVESYCRDHNTDNNKREKIRQEKSKEWLHKIKEYLDQLSLSKVLPATPLGKAIAYTLKRWHNLIRYIDHGEVEIDNNLLENSIRPIALGRKNYLFAGSHESAQRAAMIYSFFGTCKLHNINPFEWLKYVLQNINEYPINRIQELLPHNWKPKN